MELDRYQMRLLATLIANEIESRHSADLAPKWQGGSVVFKPADSGLAQHELQIDKFMHKVVMMRDNLRVLEQQINSSSSLTDGEKLKLQGYITRVYGSLTSFNFMFASPDDKFGGAGGSD
ncbi:MAG: hypothetical protein AMXMBFR68_02690 [Ignavibacteria bacterium]